MEMFFADTSPIVIIKVESNVYCINPEGCGSLLLKVMNIDKLGRVSSLKPFSGDTSHECVTL